MEGRNQLVNIVCLMVGLCLVVSCFSFSAAQVVIDGRRRPVEMYESLCVLQGGVCRYVSECPSGQLTSIKGLCPSQQAMGVECCYTGRKVRREASSSCTGTNFCASLEVCGRVAPRLGGCGNGNVCCSESVSKPVCRHKGRACLPTTAQCGQVLSGDFQDCSVQQKCCAVD